ncbi:cytochrome P450 [Streptomyces sp. NPDC051098]|uniref:cytochrome P450 n=1 Tax=Streptomyces sp. NPDC051098 TaxID=3155411 RepID=UPI003423F75B
MSETSTGDAVAVAATAVQSAATDSWRRAGLAGAAIGVIAAGAAAGVALERLTVGRRDALRRGDPADAEAFANEVRRFYPFVPFVGGLAAGELRWQGVVVPEGSLVLLDVYGRQHDPDVWPDPYAFRPERFLGRSVASDELIPQGGGDAATGHRCPGEDITVALLSCLSTRLADMNYLVPPQDLSISLRRVPARPSSGFVVSLRVPSDA